MSKKNLFEGMELTDGMSLVLFERMKQLLTVSIEEDKSRNGSFQLIQASQVLSKLKMTISDEFEIPFGWNEDAWVKLCRKAYKERVIVAAALLIAEIDRVALMEAKGEKWDPTKKEESKKQES